MQLTLQLANELMSVCHSPLLSTTRHARINQLTYVRSADGDGSLPRSRPQLDTEQIRHLLCDRPGERGVLNA